MTLIFTERKMDLLESDVRLTVAIVQNAIDTEISLGRAHQPIHGPGFKLHSNAHQLTIGISNNVAEGRALTWSDAKTMLIGLLDFFSMPPPYPSYVEVKWNIEREGRGRIGSGILVQDGDKMAALQEGDAASTNSSIAIDVK